MTEDKAKIIENYLPIPAWLNQNFLEKSIRKHSQKTFVNIRSYDILPATASGENFASVMFRVHVSYNYDDEIHRNETFVIKTAYEEGFGLSLLDELNVYEKELEMYECILPKLRTILDNAGHRGELFAGTLYVSFSKKAIVFEDLTQKGYQMPLRSNGLDITHSKILLKKLAKFHATCAVLEEHRPNVFKNFKNGMLNRETETFGGFYLNSLDALTELVAKWSGYEKYVPKLRSLRSTLIEKGKKSFDPRAHQFNTLIHGDIWVNNSMYTYNANNEPEKMMLVDFQFCCWASPTVDLHYFMNTSLKDELRLNNQEELLQFYHFELTRMLKSLQYKNRIPTLQELHVQFIESSFYECDSRNSILHAVGRKLEIDSQGWSLLPERSGGHKSPKRGNFQLYSRAFISSLLVQPIMLNEDCADADIEALHGTNEKSIRLRNTIYSNPKVHNNIKQLLPIFDRRGLLD